MGNVAIKNSYISIIHKGDVSYGGNQGWFSDKVMCGYGCGVIGGTDVLMYLMRKQAVYMSLTFPCEEAEYQKYVGFWRKKYFPVLPKVGMSGWVLVLGLRRTFKKYMLSYKVRWGVKKDKLMYRMEEMLGADILIIISVGPNFPCFWRKKGVPLYWKNSKRTYIKRQDIRVHYMVVTGIEGEKLRVSTWGKEYYLDWKEYCDYVDRYSSWLFSNICHIEKIIYK